MPRRRIANLRNHLRRCFSGLVGSEPQSGLPTYEIASSMLVDSQVAAILCKECRRSCCQAGGDHAYLNPQTLSAETCRVARCNADDLVEAYIAHIPDRTYKHSCIFHGAKVAACRSRCAAPPATAFVVPPRNGCSTLCTMPRSASGNLANKASRRYPTDLPTQPLGAYLS